MSRVLNSPIRPPRLPNFGTRLGNSRKVLPFLCTRLSPAPSIIHIDHPDDVHVLKYTFILKDLDCTPEQWKASSVMRPPSVMLREDDRRNGLLGILLALAHLSNDRFKKARKVDKPFMRPQDQQHRSLILSGHIDESPSSRAILQRRTMMIKDTSDTAAQTKSWSFKLAASVRLAI